MTDLEKAFTFSDSLTLPTTTCQSHLATHLSTGDAPSATSPAYIYIYIVRFTLNKNCQTHYICHYKGGYATLLDMKEYHNSITVKYSSFNLTKVQNCVHEIKNILSVIFTINEIIHS